jgi:hypothetical protein
MIVYAKFSVMISGLKTDMDWLNFLKGWINESVRAGLLGKGKDGFNFRNEMESDIIVELDETAGEIPPYLEPRCKNCTHWRKEDTSINGKCASPKFRYEFTRGDAQPAIDGLLAEFDEEWGTISGPEFGCIHYDERVMS